ncbi:MAG TPA: phage terminase large subunit [Chitinophagales bacterium]|nr:phage terminase large subunit [Chitinophagales bacterium]
MIEVEIDKSVYLDCYRHLTEPNDIDIELIWGGRDSGKSRFAAQYLTDTSLDADYFRCVLIKQTHESIKDAQWQMIKDVCVGWGIDSLYAFQTSPLAVKCINDNNFIARGMDNPGKIRSITNPSHAWVEEANQISEESFTTILTGMRSDHGRVKIILTFNPEATTATFEDFWLYKMFFARYPGQKNFTGTIDMELPDGSKVSLKYRSTHTTYNDNRYVPPQRIAFHESLAKSNYYWYRVFTLGEWGNKLNESPWLYAFDRSVHVRQGLKPDPRLSLDLSWDFNRNPICCTVIQHDPSHREGDKTGQVRILETIKLPNSGVDEVCQIIRTKYPGFVYRVTGDYSGDTPNSYYKEHVTNYTLIRKHLRLAQSQVQIEPNPRLEKNRTLVNVFFQHYSIVIDEDRAKAVIFDCENVQALADGTILKENRKDPAQQADALDTVRYWINRYMKGFEKRFGF